MKIQLSTLENIDLHVESLIFSSEVPIRRVVIMECLERLLGESISSDELEDILNSLLEKYNQDHYSFSIKEIDEGFCFMSKPEYHETVSTLIKHNNKSKLTRVALETLSIIAYKQPVSKTVLESIRGVNCDYTVQKLLDKDLVEIAGRAAGPGRPLLYKTSKRFMDYFGLKSIGDLPKLKDLNVEGESIGQPSDLEIVELDKDVEDGKG